MLAVSNDDEARVSAVIFTTEAKPIAAGGDTIVQEKFLAFVTGQRCSFRP